MFNRIRISLLFLWKNSLKWTAAIFALLGFIGTFVSLGDAFDSATPFSWRLAASCILLCLVWAVTFIVSIFYVLFCNRRKIIDLNGGHHVYVQYGDIFSEKTVGGSHARRNIVIPVNRCFDTLVDDRLISANTLHGKAMKKLYDINAYTPQNLYDAITQNLNAQGIASIDVPSAEKPAGNTKRFPAGTVAEINDQSNVVYFFLGLSSFDRNLAARTSDEELVLSLMKLIEYCEVHSQQYPVVMPLIGAGLSRTGKTEGEILKFLLGLLEFNKERIYSDIHIIIHKSQMNKLSIIDI